MSTLTASHGLTLSKTGLKLIKAYEGYRPVDRILVSGQRVVGYGHRLYDDKPRQLSKADAEALLISDLRAYEDMINENVYSPLTQGQFDALVSFAFNIGPKAFLASETLHAMNNGRPLDAANALDVWRKSTVNGKTYIIDALMRRRTAEKALFLRTESYPCPASGIDLPPVKDESLASIVLEKDAPIYEQKQASGIVATAPFTLDELAEGRVGTQEDDVLDVEDIVLNPDRVSEHARRRDDGPAGVLMLSEVAEAPVMKGPLIDEEDLTDEGSELGTESEVDTVFDSELDVAVAAQSVVEDESILMLNEIVDEAVEESKESGSLIDPKAELEIETALDALSKSDSIAPSDVAKTVATLDNQVDVNRSVIAEAAADISERLDALIEDAKDPDKEMDWPENLTDSDTFKESADAGDDLVGSLTDAVSSVEESSVISANAPILMTEALAESKIDLPLSNDDRLEEERFENAAVDKEAVDKEVVDREIRDREAKETVQEKVSLEDSSDEDIDFENTSDDVRFEAEDETTIFENDSLEETLEPAAFASSDEAFQDEDYERTEDMNLDEAADLNHADVVIDNLAEDDAMRDYNNDMSIFYERHNMVEPQQDPNNIGFWMIMLGGFILLGMTLAISLRGAEALMGPWGPLVVISGVLIGALMVMGAAYYAIRDALSYN